MSQKLVEFWLRGPVEGVPALLQPVAHALLQAREEVNGLLQNFNDNDLWMKPAGVASVAFHLQHLSGVLDRLFSYAKGNLLSTEQLEALKAEGKFDPSISVLRLLKAFNDQVSSSLNELMLANETQLLETRGVGRANIPSTTLGLYVHAAEHTMRHTGQLLVTVKFINQAGV